MVVVWEIHWSDLMNNEDAVSLRDGRKIGYAEYGDPEGYPILFFHGMPGSRYWHHPNDSMTASMGVRLIVVERPGYGVSSSKKKRRVIDWPDDVIEVVDALGISKFAVAGVSAGGPHVLACAYKIPDRLSSATVIGSLSPPDSFKEIDLEKWKHYKLATCPIVGRGWKCMSNFIHYCDFKRNGKNDEAYFDASASQLSDVDQMLLEENLELRAMYIENMAESHQNGYQGRLDDAVCVSKQEWGFELEEIQLPVTILHGDQDILTPIQMGRYLETVIPKSLFDPISDAGHLLWFELWKDILSGLLPK
jgi:pimeloyl-ACP methyl ester carboxylesterase